MRVPGTTYWGEYWVSILVEIQTITHRIMKGRCLSSYPGLREVCEEMFSKDIRSPLLLGVLVDMYQELGDEMHLKTALKVRTCNTIDR